MKTLTAILISLLLVACNSKNTRITFKPSVSRSSILLQGCDFSHLEVCIQNADQALGSATGTITIPDGDGTLNGTTILHAGHALVFGAGTYQTTAVQWTQVFRMQDNTSIIGIGDGRDGGPATVFMEPPSFDLINDDNDCCVDGNAPGNVNLTIGHFKVVGSGKQSYPNGVIIATGNSQHVRVSDLTLDGVYAMGFETGNGSANGNHGDDVIVSGCIFKNMLGTALAGVNSTHFTFEGNVFSKVQLPIDVEPNTPTDLASDFVIRGNTGFGAWIQGPQTGPGTIEDNDGGVAVNNAHDLLIHNNHLGRTGDPRYPAVYLIGAVNCVIEDNSITDAGGINGWSPAVVIETGKNPDGTWRPSVGNVFQRNTIGSISGGSGLIVERVPVGAEGSPPTGNTYTANALMAGVDALGNVESAKIVLLGSTSVANGNRVVNKCP
jgi:hypothetical protein